MRTVKNNHNGERTLVAAIIDQAVRDAQSGPKEYRASARKYLASGMYVHHLGLLELPTDWLPEAIERAAEMRMGL